MYKKRTQRVAKRQSYIEDARCLKVNIYAGKFIKVYNYIDGTGEGRLFALSYTFCGLLRSVFFFYTTFILDYDYLIKSLEHFQ